MHTGQAQKPSYRIRTGLRIKNVCGFPGHQMTDSEIKPHAPADTCE
jgi:hypothetical protein